MTTPSTKEHPTTLAVKVPEEVLRELDAHPTAIDDLALLWNAGEAGRRLALEIADQFNARRTK